MLKSAYKILQDVVNEVKRMRPALKSGGNTAWDRDAGQDGRPNLTMASLDLIRNSMEDVGTRIVDQIQWTEGALARVGERNQLVLGG